MVDDGDIKERLAPYLDNIALRNPHIVMRKAIGLRKVGKWQWLNGQPVAKHYWFSKPDEFTAGQCAMLIKTRDHPLQLSQITCNVAVGYLCQIPEGKDWHKRYWMGYIPSGPIRFCPIVFRKVCALPAYDLVKYEPKRKRLANMSSYNIEENSSTTKLETNKTTSTFVLSEVNEVIKKILKNNQLKCAMIQFHTCDFIKIIVVCQ